MITKDRIFKLAFQVFSLLCFVAIVVCFICNIVISKSFIWARYPMLSILYGWLIISPLLLAAKHKIISSLVAMSIVTIPFLYFFEKLTPFKGWFYELSLPIAITGIIAVWITYFFLRFLKINIWYRLSAGVFLYGAVIASIVNYYVDTFVNVSFFRLSSMLNIFSCIVVSALLVIIGNYKNTIKQHKDQLEDNEKDQE